MRTWPGSVCICCTVLWKAWSIAAVETSLCPVSSKDRQKLGTSWRPDAALAALWDGGLIADLSLSYLSGQCGTMVWHI